MSHEGQEQHIHEHKIDSGEAAEAMDAAIDEPRGSSKVDDAAESAPGEPQRRGTMQGVYLSFFSFLFRERPEQALCTMK